MDVYGWYASFMIEAKEAAMNTSKMLIGWTLVLVGALMLGGLFLQDSLFMAFAGTGLAYTLLRGMIAALLIGLLLTEPPRTHLFRTMLAVWSVALAVTTGQLLLTYQIHLLDAVLFLEVAIIFAVEALEASTNKAGKPVARKIPVRKISVSRRITVATASS